MNAEPAVKRVIAFVDGQNLYHTVKAAFGYSFPNYDIRKLAEEVCATKEADGWTLCDVHFYTGIPSVIDEPNWNSFWQKKLTVMGTTGVIKYARELKYREKDYQCPKCKNVFTITSGQEKGVDLRLAIDAIRLARMNAYDVCLVFSQDQDFTELAKEIRGIAKEYNRWIKIASAYPISSTSRNKRGIYRSDWIPFDRTLYDRCIDPNDYRL